MKEILWNGIVHYRSPDDDPDIKEAEEYIKNNDTLYSIRDA